MSAVWYRKDPAVACSSGVDAATYYTYDIHGNVKTFVSETNINDRLYYIGENLKQTDYYYDLWSGNVNEVVYQQGAYDEFRHRYYYDADNRLISAYTSKNGIIWEKERKQFYYAYGPLARTELGDKQVQGTDYAYTILGWVKGINSNTLSPARDLGKDGANTTGNLNRNFAYDAAAYSLGYFTNDYKAIDATLNNTSSSFLASETNNPANGYKQNSYDLYNGNISRMVTVMRDASGSAIPVQGRTFRYDQLNRIKEVNAWTDANIITSNNWSTGAANNNDYYEAFTFDMNGNIETAIRNGNLTGTHQYMDNMTYQYTAGTNKLDFVNDLGLALSSDYDMDIDGGQTQGNYQYDAIGNLISDVSEEIQNIEWNVQGKIVKITRTNTSNKSDLEFLYDASGKRIAKIVKPRVNGTLQTEDKWKYTIYARDASGNVMAVYEFDYKTMSGNNNYRIQHDLKEHNIYAGSRLGMSYDQQVAVTRDFTLAVSGNGTFDFYTAPSTIWNTTTQLPAVSTTIFDRELGYKAYELANHLGNVLATVSDRRIPVGSAGVISNFLPEVMTYTDYYAFGSNMPGRTYVNANGKYRYDFNGKETDPESDLQDYGMRIYNPALAKFLSVDPITSKYPMLTPYQFASNCCIWGVDLDGQEFFLNPATAAAISCWLYDIQSTGQEGMSNIVQGSGGNDEAYDNLGIPGQTQTILNTQQVILGVSQVASATVKIVSPVAHTILDVVGIIPIVGEWADGLNAGIYMLEGDYTNASLSMAAAVPFVGWFATAGKWSSKVWAATTKTAVKYSDETAQLISYEMKQAQQVRAGGTLTGDAKIIGRETVTVVKSGLRTDALKVAKEAAGSLGAGERNFIGKFGTQEGRVVGRQSADGSVGWRIDYSTDFGAHYNWWNHTTGQKGCVPFSGTYADVERQIDLLNTTY